MIYTECPYCDEPQCFVWEYGDPNGYFPAKCHKCGKIMWIEATSLGSITMSHEDFKKNIMIDGDEKKVENAAKNAITGNSTKQWWKIQPPAKMWKNKGVKND